MAGLHADAGRSEVFEETKTAGATLIKLKGGSGFAVGLSIREVVHALALDSRRVLPVSTLQQGLYGVRDVCLSVPTVVGCGGARQQIELALTPKERTGHSAVGAGAARDIDQVEKRIGKVRDGEADSLRTAAATAGPIPRTAWQTAITTRSASRASAAKQILRSRRDGCKLDSQV